MNAPSHIVLGIDPGTRIVGYGVVAKTGSQVRALQYGVIGLTRFVHWSDKLKEVFECIRELVKAFTPQIVAIESPFMGKNAQSMLKLGRVQGVAMAAALMLDCSVTEYAPCQIKQVVSGRGNASKTQLAHMVVATLGLSEIPDRLDASDALAVALCHLYVAGSGL